MGTAKKKAMINVPEALRNRVIDIAAARKKQNAPNYTLDAVYVEALEKGMEAIDHEESKQAST